MVAHVLASECAFDVANRVVKTKPYVSKRMFEVSAGFPVKHATQEIEMIKHAFFMFVVHLSVVINSERILHVVVATFNLMEETWLQLGNHPKEHI